MTTPILNKVSFTNVPGGLGLLDKIRTTAVSWGWTQAHWYDAQVLDYDTNTWDANVNGGFLCLTSPGQGGSQNLIARLELAKHTVENRYDICVGMSSTTTLDLTSTLKLFFQDVVACDSSRYQGVATAGEGHYNGVSLPTTNIPEIWILGNDQYIYVCANLDGVFHTMMEFGSHQQRKVTPTNQDGSMVTTLKVDRDSLWSTYAGYSPQGVSRIFGIPALGENWFQSDSVFPHKFVHQEGLQKSFFDYNDYLLPNGTQSEIFWSLEVVAPYTISNYKALYQCFTNSYSDCFTPGDNSGRRFMMRNTLFYKRATDGLIIPYAETFASLFNGQGLQPAQSIFYGSDEYIVFPCCSILAPIWLAFRIA